MASGQAAAVIPPGLFRNRFCQTILLSNVLLQIGIWVRNFAILLYVAEKTNDDPMHVVLIQFVEYAPIFIFSFIGGTFADRWRPKRTMIWCDLLSAASVFVVLLTMLTDAWQTIYLVTLVSAILSQFSQPSAMKLFKAHVPPEQLQQAMAMFQSLMAIFLVGGPALGIFVYNQFGIYLSIAVMGAAFLLSALVLVRIPESTESAPAVDSGPASRKGGFWKEMGEGFRYVWRSPVLRTLGATFALAGLAVGITQALGLYVVIERLDKPREFLQYIMMAVGVAMLLGGGIIAGIAKKVPPQKLLAFGLLVGAATTAGIGYSENAALTLTLQFIGGLVFPAIHIGITTMILQWSEEDVVGRVNGILNPMFVGMMAVMMPISGLLKREMPLETIYAISGLSMLLGMLVLVPIFKHKPPELAAAVKAPSGMPSH